MPQKKTKPDPALCVALQEVANTPYDAVVTAEVTALRPIFNAAAQTLAPHARNSMERAAMRPDTLAYIFAEIARAHRAVMVGRPLVIADGDMGRTVEDYNGIINLRDTGIQNAVIRRMEPSNGRTRTRMFGTGYFGFLTVFRRAADAPASSVVVPYVSLPPIFSYLARNTGGDLLEAFAENTALINHDWIHSLLIGTINSSIVMRPDNAPITTATIDLIESDAALSTGRLHDAVIDGNRLRDAARVLPETVYGGGYEDWAMRAHREIMTVLADRSDNVLSQSVDRYLAAWRGFADNSAAMGVMPDIGMTPAAFAMKLLAFNLVRVVPRDHELVARCIAADEGGQASAIFDYMYDRRMAKRVLFGHGGATHRAYDDNRRVPERNLCRTPADYGRAVLGATTEAITLAHEDARDALYWGGLSAQAQDCILKDGRNADRFDRVRVMAMTSPAP